ncbi:hypothetical protein J7337_004812 [Fusarium musae]|uniref:Peptidase M3A/M3B catalytic domain-containing protein n=1 Tax=Fusarium musae TaxID=1042133 RepID=A0A9P8DMC5_9HYPO|nr:hypothetical protein J7337_004812 [Fusarium musae]KAG9504834.1 hypothetical protein J7337_004812 [Fusarium musae]
MGSKSLPQPLPKLIPADQVIPTMKGIINQYQAVREGIFQNVNPQATSFRNVIQPLIDIDNATQGDIGIIAMLRYASPDQASRQASEEACTLINEDQAAFTARSDFWCLIKAVKEGTGEPSLHFEARKYLNKMFLEFEQFGHATLRPEPVKRRGLWFSLDDLSGVPQHNIDRFEKHSENHDMRFVRFSVAYSLAIYRSASKPATRKRMYVGDANNLSQNDGLFKQIAVERDLNARILDYESHAAYRPKKRLMKTPDIVEEFLTDLETKLMARGKRDMKSLVELKKQNEPENSIDEGFNDDMIFPWEYWYYARMAQQRRHVSQDRVAEYFHLQHVIKVMLEMFSEFLSIQFFPISPHRLKGSIWHEDVHVWAVWEDSLPLSRSPPDFAEALSVMLEKWCWMEPELKRLGLHYTRTDPQLKEKWLREHPGEELPPAQIPDDMIQILTQGQQVTRSLWFLRQM